jgi:hypothetical protein
MSVSNSDARFALGLAGAAIGLYFGYPGLGFAIGSFIGGLAFPPEGQDSGGEGARLDNLAFADSKYGSVIPILYGTFRMGITYVWATDIVERVKESKVDGGGKGGGGGSTTTKTYTYFGNFMCLVCESPAAFPVAQVEKILADKRILADFSSATLTSPVYSALLSVVAGNVSPFESGAVRIHVGAEDQLPDSLVESHVGVGLTPAYRGVCTVVYDDMPLINYGNRIPQIEMVVSTIATPVFPKVDLVRTTSTNNFFIPDGIRVFSSGNDLTPWIINSHTQSEIVPLTTTRTLEPMVRPGNSNGNSFLGFNDVNILNEGISEDNDLSSVGIPGLHDVDTGAAIARPIDRIGWIGGGNTSTYFFTGSAQEFIFAQGLGVEDNQWCWYASTNVEEIDPITGLPLFPFNLMEKLGATYTTDGVGGGIDSGLSAPGILGTAITSEGDLWMSTHRAAGNFELHKMTPGGTVEQTFDLGASFTGQSGLGYEGTTNSLFFVQGNVWHKWFIDTETIDPDSVTGGTPTGSKSLFRQGSINGELVVGTGGGTGERIDIVGMRRIKLYDWTDWGAPSTSEQPMYDPILNAVVMTPATNTPISWLFLDRESSGGVTLQSILDDLDNRAGYLAGTDTDATNHNSTNVPGWIIGGRTQVKSVKQSLSELYQFLVVEEEHVIQHPSRGTATVDAIVSDDLGASDQRKESKTRRLEETRTQELEMPKQVEYGFIEGTFDHQKQIVSSRRIKEVVNTERLVKKTYPVNLTVTEAQRRVEVALHQSWMDRTRYKFNLLPKKMLLSPGDTITINHEGSGHVVTLLEVDMGANNMIECVGIGFPMPVEVVASEADTILANIQTLNPSTTGGSSGAFIPGTLDDVLNPTRLLMMDIPLMLDPSDPFPGSSGVTVSARGMSVGADWDGTSIVRGAGVGERKTFIEWNFYNSANEGIVGVTTNALEPIPTRDSLKGGFDLFTLLDTTSTLTVQFDPGISFASVNFLELTQEKNAFLVGDEILQVMTVVDDGDGEWTFSNFLRGRKGTEESDTHTEFEDVVVLTDLDVQVYNTALGELNNEFFYKAYTINGGQEIVNLVGYEDTGRIIAPRPVGHVSGVKTGDDWTITYKRRGRFDANLGPSDVISLSQSSHEYEVDILLKDELTVIRTITSTATANGSVVTVDPDDNADVVVTYDQLDIEADFGESPVVSPYPLYRIMCKIYQLETSLGATNERGFVKTGRIDDFPIPALDGDYSSVSLLLQCNSVNAKDKGPHRIPLTVSNVTFTPGSYWDKSSPRENSGITADTQGGSQYALGALFFDNQLNASITATRVNMGTFFDLEGLDWTIEAWFKQLSDHDGSIVGVYGSAPDREWLFRTDNNASNNNFDGALHFIYSTTGSDAISLGGNYPLLDLGLKHVAACRTSGNIELFAQGVRIATDTISSDIFSGGNADLVIGDGDGKELDGWLDALRITKGVARYTGTTYTVPQTRFSNG